MNIDQRVQSVTDQLAAVRQLKEELCEELVRRLLEVMDVGELHVLVDRVHYEDFAKGEIASHYDIQAWGDNDDGLPF
ncbi:hypothetical protein HPC37_04575 [Pasteurellaceae bacterium 20609_3]|uniref:hypothetical protein n=1 Tax=Spirabiliibacterium mucosae TaxID=28156 RepID=UPI001AAC96F6|nr:hypothetical protein [Spirabiliibacterium mucosae]MBE2898116.1 hypothetical protein [Spirabiliibacterium mucosae]